MNKYLLSILLIGGMATGSAQSSTGSQPIYLPLQKLIPPQSTWKSNPTNQKKSQTAVQSDTQKSGQSKTQSSSDQSKSYQTSAQKKTQSSDQKKTQSSDQKKTQSSDQKKTQSSGQANKQSSGQTDPSSSSNSGQSKTAHASQIKGQAEGQKKSQTSWAKQSSSTTSKKKSDVKIISEQSRESETDQKIPTFTFSLLDAKSNAGYTLMAVNIYGDCEILHPALKRNLDGKLMDGNDPYKLSTLGMGPGETLNLIATSNDGLEIGKLALIPRPLQANCNGYTISLRLEDPKSHIFQMHATGFAPKEEIQLFTCSGLIRISEMLIANEFGEINSTLLHSGNDVLGGEAYVELKGKNGPASITYPWGSDYQKELRNIKKVERNLLRDHKEIRFTI